MLGHIALAVVPGIAAVAIGLILVAHGSGGLRASATAVVGSLYAPTTPDATRASLLIIVAVVAAAVSYFVVIISSRHVTDTERSRVFAFIPLFIASVACWSLDQQQFTVLTIYSDQRLDRFIGGFEMPVPWVQSINPVFIIVLSGVFAAIWTKLGHRQPATPLKFAAGTMTLGLPFLLFLPFAGVGQLGALLAVASPWGAQADARGALNTHPELSQQRRCCGPRRCSEDRLPASGREPRPGSRGRRPGRRSPCGACRCRGGGRSSRRLP
jgi:dipeptide/tripeptide permease